MRRFVRRMLTPTGVVALVLIAVLTATAIVAPIVLGDAADARDPTALNQGPSADNWAGTDGLGRDILVRVLVATRTSLLLALATTTLAVVGGLLLGLLPSVVGRRPGRGVAATIDLLLGFPGLLVVLLVATVLGVGARGAVLALGLATIPAYARIVHTNSSAIGSRDFVAAARSVGVGRWGVMRIHVLPNVAEPLIVASTMVMSGALLAFGGLSFLGLGVQAPDFDWGRLLDEGLDRIYVNPAAAIAPAVPLVVAGLAFALLGESAARATSASDRPVGPGDARLAAVFDVAARETPAPEHSVVAETAVRPSDGAHGVVEAGASSAVVTVRDLRVAFASETGPLVVVDGVDLSVDEGEAVGIVGESGSGKTLTALAIAGLLPSHAAFGASCLETVGVDLCDRVGPAARSKLGAEVAVVFQNPATSFNPSMRVGAQLAELGRIHLGLGRSRAGARAVERMRHVRIPAPERRARQYPHELSGGTIQRAMLALGLMGTPRLLLADEPTTALDVTVQRQILQLLRRVSEETGAALVFISHDIAVVSQVCDRVVVMYAGRVVEELPVAQLGAAAHPYTRALLAAVPDLTVDRDAPLATIAGRPPEPGARLAGCAFAPRCERATSSCRDVPSLTPVGRPPAAERHVAACWHPVVEAMAVVDG